MKLGVIIATIIGLAIAGYLILRVGVGPVVNAVLSVGFGGFAIMCMSSLTLPAILGAAWFSLVSNLSIPRMGMFAVARQVRDSASDILPFSQLGGIVIGVRAIILRGMATPIAFASSIADITTELMAQLAFIAMGAAFFVAQLQLSPSQAHMIEGIAAFLALMIPGIFAFVFLQTRGAGFAMTLAGRWIPSAVQHATAFEDAVKSIYRSPRRLAVSATFHLAGWIVNGLVTYIAIRLTGAKIGVVSAIAIESLLSGLKSATAFVPASIGVQEAGYAGLMPFFGLGPEIGLAVSLLRRARDIVVGVPVLLAWQAMEGHRAFVRADSRTVER